MTNVTREEWNKIQKGDREKVEVVDTVYDKTEKESKRENEGHKERLNKQWSVVNSKKVETQKSTNNSKESAYDKAIYNHRYKVIGDHELIMKDDEYIAMLVIYAFFAVCCLIGGFSDLEHGWYFIPIGIFLIGISKTLRTIVINFVKKIPEYFLILVGMIITFFEKLPGILWKCIKRIGITLLAVGAIALALFIKRFPLYLILKRLKGK